MHIFSPFLSCDDVEPRYQTVAANTTSEDCLTLNIYRPAGLTKDSYIPVVAYIFGGGFRGEYLFDNLMLSWAKTATQAELRPL